MVKRYKIDWEMKGIGKDERVYLRGLIKTLMRYDVLEQLPRGSQVSCRNKIQGFVSVIPGSHRLAEEQGFNPPTSRQLADAIMGIVNEELL